MIHHLIVYISCRTGIFEENTNVKAS